jgi:xanthine dehydrogenase accessory factor
MLHSDEFFDRVSALKREGQTFAVATVVARRPPVSAHLGDRAIIFADGRMEGFVGGACSREIIRKQALDVLRVRAARLVSIRPDAGEAADAGPDCVIVPMTCASEGAVDVYVEPVARPRSIVVVGATPVADAVGRLARAMRYDVVRVVAGDERRDLEAHASEAGAGVAALEALDEVLAGVLPQGGDCAVVVASQGHYDEPALEVALRSRPSYVGLVASRRRGDTVRAWLAENHVPNLNRLRNPAGLDLGARSPEEVALSILGEIVQLRTPAPNEATAAPQGGTVSGPQDSKTPRPQDLALDPVCHMEVDTAAAAHVADVNGVTYYFCCGGCRARFVKDPQRYLTPAS